MSDDLGDIDWKAFDAAILRPKRRRFDEVLRDARALAGEQLGDARRRLRARGEPPILSRAEHAEALADDAFLAAAWEALTDRFDASHLLEGALRGARSFHPFLPRGAYYGKPGPLVVRPERNRPIPWDLETIALLVAADPGELLAAEAAGLEAAAALGPWGTRPPRRVAWRLVRECHADGKHLPSVGSFVRPGTSARAAMDLSNTVLVSVRRAMGLPSESPEWLGMTEDELGAPRLWPRSRASSAGASWACWRTAAAERRAPSVLLGVTYATPEGRLFGDLPDPFDPLMRVWGVGYEPIDVVGDVLLMGVSMPFDLPLLSAPTLTAIEREAVRRDSDGR